ncbi:MAG: hypothetical protein Q8918_14760 [Bacteroidota bacterium]|nr:hypothetical protein [Bacteroidota bacterium]MDP4212247.1 hypothetical protein [Bacteroidota bacterium]MDP4251363.1 hypothetical protein [Bacteroidota bacterium]
MKKSFVPFLLSALVFASCTSHNKKILLYANSEIQVDESQKNIVVKEGSSHVEKELDFSGSSPVELTIQGPAGKYTLDAKEDGLYIANLKSDTVVGSLQHVGKIAQTRMTQDQLKSNLDSLNKLVRDENVSAANKNYFIAPGKMVKLTDFTKAKVFGPFTSIPSSFDAGSVPEIYKFYNLSEVNDIIHKLTEMGRYKEGDSQ